MCRNFPKQSATTFLISSLKLNSNIRGSRSHCHILNFSQPATSSILFDTACYWTRTRTRQGAKYIVCGWVLRFVPTGRVSSSSTCGMPRRWHLYSTRYANFSTSIHCTCEISFLHNKIRENKSYPSARRKTGMDRE